MIVTRIVGHKVCATGQVSPPKLGDTDSLQMMVTNLDFDQHKGRLAIGRVNSGKLIKGQTVAICKSGGELIESSGWPLEYGSWKRL